MVHKLKTVQPFFNQVKEGIKKFELRKNDRDFKKGDILILEEYDPEDALDEESKNDGYTGKIFAVRIDYMLENFAGIEKDYCILGVTKTRI
jgi:ParB family chromosome partitioning protein